ncbi:hypothetical protein [Moorena sp. SIOASIH]|nr:hypothetical protein [Moorena sp. SIOASIH]
MKHFYLLVSEKFFSFNLPYNEYGANNIQPLTFNLPYTEYGANNI